MTPSNEPIQPGGSAVDRIVETARTVITDPVAFYERMARTGGFAEPVIFVAVMGAVSALMGALLSVFGLGPLGNGHVVATLIVTPIVVVIFNFIFAGAAYMFWRLLGSEQTYETAFRCLAYSMAITPITSVLNVIPYIGPLIGMAWAFYLIVIASELVHKISRSTAQLAFGILFVVMALGSITSQMAASRYEDEIGKFSESMEGVEDMSPEEAGRAMGDFLKGLQKSIDQKNDGGS